MIGQCTRIVNVLSLVLGVTLANAAEPMPVKVFVATPERVIDGDSIRYPQGVCRLLAIDAPERKKGQQPGQPMAEEAFKALRDEAMRGPTTVIVYGRDKYERLLCWVIDHAGYALNLMLVESGFGIAYMTERSPFAAGLLEAQRRAQAEKRGIWSLPKRETPEAYRKRMREEK